MSIKASDVKALRDKTGAGMMDCKKALVETGGDIDEAVEYLRKKGIAKAEKKSDRIAAEGLVATWVADNSKAATIIEVNCETDFVARNEDFQAFCDDLAAHMGEAGIDNLPTLLESSFRDGTVESTRNSLVAKIGENITIRRAERVTLDGPGLIGTYIHGGGSIGVLTILTAGEEVAGNETAEELARDLAMHIAAMSPEYTRPEEIITERLERERAILSEEAKASGKPDNIVEKMVEGRLRKWTAEICLVGQGFVKDPDVTVEKHVKNVSKEVGTTIRIQGFVRYLRGEGIEKPECNLAEEVAATIG